MTTTAFGLMLHHFHGQGHPHAQGAISASQFERLLDYMGVHNFLSPEEWTKRAETGTLAPNHRCITFDDALLCQYEIAAPVLASLGLKAFWFVYSGVFHGDVDAQRLEIFRHYRTVRFPSVNDFYSRFFHEVEASRSGDLYALKLPDFDADRYLSQFPFYTKEDKLFRYTRDVILGRARYYEIMDSIISADSDYSWSEASRHLWMTDEHIRSLHSDGHTIGMHSYTHPTDMAALSPSDQRHEYERNREHIRAVTGFSPESVSHPCGSYNADTLSILSGLGARIGFRSNMQTCPGLLCLPREDHSNIVKKMEAN